MAHLSVDDEVFGSESSADLRSMSVLIHGMSIVNKHLQSVSTTIGRRFVPPARIDCPAHLRSPEFIQMSPALECRRRVYAAHLVVRSSPPLATIKYTAR